MEAKKYKIVVANSVGRDSDGYYLVHSPSRWSVGWKGYREVFTYYPWELAYLSSMLKISTRHDVRFMDGCLNKWGAEEYLSAIYPYEPDWLIMESSSRSFDEDIRMALLVRECFGTKLVFCGQHPTAFPKKVSRLVDYVCIGEYEESVLDIINGKDNVPGVYPNSRRPLLDFESLPMPEDSDVRRIDYAVPGEPSSEYREIQIYASRGCPFSCRFCVCSNLYYNKPNWRPRKVSSIITEIEILQFKYPEVEGFFFDEELHNGSKTFVIELTTALKEAGLHTLKYEAMCAYWNMDKEMLQAMKEAGYYKIRIGIETASETAAAGLGLGKKHCLGRLREVLDAAKEVGMKVYGTFTVGGEGSTREEDLKTGVLIQELTANGLLNGVQVSINTPQPGTPFYKDACKKGWILTKDWKKYDGGNFAVVDFPHYSSKDVEQTYRDVLSCYDDGLYEKNREEFLKNLTGFLNDISVTGALLLGRAARMWHVRLIAEAVKTQVDILSQDGIPLKKIPNQGHVYTYGSGFFTCDSLSSEMLGKIDYYSAILIPCNNFRGDGYMEWERLVKNLDGVRGFFVFPDGTGAEI